MKKVFLPLILGLVLGACSRDNSEKEDGVLVSQIIKKDVGEEVEVINFKYDGNKILEVVGDDYKQKYQYTGNLITSMVETMDDSSRYEVNFYYDANGKLLRAIEKGESPEQRFIVTRTYVYNGDDTVLLIDESKGEYLKPVVRKFKAQSEIKYTIQNNLIKKIEELDGRKNITTFEYDGKNSPFKNIKGFPNLYIELEGEFFHGTSIIQNISKLRLKGNYTSPTIENYRYDYNNKGYPIRSVVEEEDSSGKRGVSVIEYTYN